MKRADSPYIVDKTKQLDAIKREYGPRYFCEVEAIAKAATLWGAACNDCGVIENASEIIEVEHKRYRAEVRLYGTAKGYWFMGLNLTTSQSGFGTPPSVWEPYAFTDDMHARRWALDYLIQRLTSSSECSKPDPAKAAFLQMLEDAKAKQLCLL